MVPKSIENLNLSIITCGIIDSISPIPSIEKVSIIILTSLKKVITFTAIQGITIFPTL